MGDEFLNDDQLLDDEIDGEEDDLSGGFGDVDLDDDDDPDGVISDSFDDPEEL